MAETGGPIVNLGRWWQDQLVADLRGWQEDPQEVLQQAIQLGDLQELAGGNITALLEQTQCLVQGAGIDHNAQFLGGKEDIHEGHVLGGALIAAGQDQDAGVHLYTRCHIPLEL